MNKSKKLFYLSPLIGLLFTLNVYADTVEVSLIKDIKPGISTDLNNAPSNFTCNLVKSMSTA